LGRSGLSSKSLSALKGSGVRRGVGVGFDAAFEGVTDDDCCKELDEEERSFCLSAPPILELDSPRLDSELDALTSDDDCDRLEGSEEVLLEL
jgi:hypothetical protein